MKYPGGKAEQADELVLLLRAPTRPAGYRETCLGAGGAYLTVAHDIRPAVLSDIDPEIIDMHRAVQQDPEGLIAALARHQAAFDATAASWDAYQRAYYALRAVDPTTLPSTVERAARTIALNKLAHSGLYRKNQAGEFNAPVAIQGRKLASGGAKVVRLFDAANVRLVSRRLQRALLVVCDLEDGIDAARPGELLYVDLPYAPRQEGGFTAYGGRPFTWDDQIRTARALERARQRGVLVATSNHDLPHVRALFPGPGWNFTTIDARRAINTKGGERGVVPELLVRSFR